MGIAMGNACEEIKRLAKVIVPVNDDDGVGYAIEKYIL
ncbi:MAG: HAD hydrolase family protein [Christensenellales bacterium]